MASKLPTNSPSVGAVRSRPCHEPNLKCTGCGRFPAAPLREAPGLVEGQRVACQQLSQVRVVAGTIRVGVIICIGPKGRVDIPDTGAAHAVRLRAGVARRKVDEVDASIRCCFLDHEIQAVVEALKVRDFICF